MRTRERSRRHATLAFVVILPLFMAAFAGKCDKNSNNKNSSERTAQEIAVDNLLNTQVREDITTKSQVPALRAIDIEINTFKLKVTLTGKVATQAARDEAIRLAGLAEVEKDGAKFKAREVDASKLKVEP